ncbi:hypothetical protein EDD16DRAFT_1515890 [Pisolithus croceorrhizus]|nr:hypothetical protein EDD16DRAFT_1515890 [Pisolithus croceorrhizus]KAI6135879.1 hypothetical protein EV401DRAFT_1881934 [Pisolithus croceorrhizus]KAI6169624.1 hypothetical protein EDD17DRAFT_1502580 [Pisolithus thermaeus]
MTLRAQYNMHDTLSQSLFSFDHSPQGFYLPISSNPDMSHRGAKPSEDELKQLKLWAEKPTQFSELGTLIYVGKNLDTRDLCSQIWQQVTNYKVLNGIEEIMVDLKNMKSVVEAVTSRLKGSFELSIDQMMQVTITCKDMLVQAGCTKYKALHTDVEHDRSSSDHRQNHWDFRTCSEILGMSRCSMQPLRGNVVQFEANSTHWHQASGWEAMYDTGRTYMDSTQQMQASTIMQGHINTSIQGWMQVMPVGLKVAKNQVLSHQQNVQRHTMDWLLVKDLNQYGKDMNNDQWCNFFIQIILTDQEHYGKNSGTLLPSLPMTYMESHVATPGTTSTISHPFPATTYHGPSHMQSLGHCPVTGTSLCPSHGDSLDSLPATEGTEELLGEDF